MHSLPVRLFSAGSGFTGSSHTPSRCSGFWWKMTRRESMTPYHGGSIHAGLRGSRAKARHTGRAAGLRRGPRPSPKAPVGSTSRQSAWEAAQWQRLWALNSNDLVAAPAVPWDPPGLNKRVPVTCTQLRFFSVSIISSLSSSAFSAVLLFISQRPSSPRRLLSLPPSSGSPVIDVQASLCLFGP